MRLTNYFIKKKVQSLASGAAGRKHEFCALEDAGHILVLYQANDRELVEPCLDVLGAFAQGEEGHQDVCVCAVRRSGYSFRRFQYSCTYKERSQRVGIPFR